MDRTFSSSVIFPPAGSTEPAGDSLSDFQPIRISRAGPPPPLPRRRMDFGCWLGILLVAGVFFVVLLGGVLGYLLTPGQVNLLVLGMDRPQQGGNLSRTDTMILTALIPARPEVRMLSIPRDLWVPVQGYGENRINTAHFFAEAEKAGTGPQAAIRVVEQNFKVPVDYYVRVRFEGFKDMIDAMGGVTIVLKTDTALYPAGTHHLDGTKALAFVRDRKNADDFFRMEHGQVLIRAVVNQLLSPLTWPRLPLIAASLLRSVDTNLPLWLWPRLGMTLLRVGPEGIDSHSLTRDYVTPTITSGGADVLMPRWERIRPLAAELFAKPK